MCAMHECLRSSHTLAGNVRVLSHSIRRFKSPWSSKMKEPVENHWLFSLITVSMAKPGEQHFIIFLIGGRCDDHLYPSFGYIGFFVLRPFQFDVFCGSLGELDDIPLIS